jgi:hypothetical protein
VPVGVRATGRQRLRGEQQPVEHHADPDRPERRPPAEPGGQRRGQQQRPDQVTDRAQQVGSGQRGLDPVPGHVDERDLHRNHHRVAGEAHHADGHDQRPELTRGGEQQQAGAVAEPAQRGHRPPADPVGDQAERRCQHADAGVEGEQEPTLGVGQVEVASNRLEGPEGQECHRLVDETHDEQGQDKRRGDAGC